MNKKIIIAGAGHGGLAVAAQLAKAGLDVTVYERSEKENLGYDWFDALNPAVFGMIGCPHPEEAGIPWEWRADITYFGPNTTEEHKIPQKFKNSKEIEIIMERRDIYKLLCSYATDCGAKIEYGVNIKAPIMGGNRVIGISTDKGDFYADLIIDAAGMNSVIRRNLPSGLGIQKDVLKNERIYVYRAFYDLPVPPETVKDVFKVMFRPDEGEDFGLSWIYTRDTYTDLLIGRMDPPDTDLVDKIAAGYRKNNPQLGEKRLRGGQVVPIPFRRPLSLLVADGYAAIGDSAFMTMPLNCSGMSVSLEVSKILAEAVLADTEGAYTVEKLWRYQYRFFRLIGKNIAPIALVKDMIISLTQEELNYAFDTGLITYKELSITADQHSIWQFLHFDPNLPQRGVKLAKNRALAKKAADTVRDVTAFFTWADLIPQKYSEKAVRKWVVGYDKIFTRRLKKLFPAYYCDMTNQI